MKSMTYYFDYAAATPMSETVLDAMRPFWTEKFYNPSALYLAAQDVRRVINQARGDIAGILGCKAPEIIFTAGGTESDNLAVSGIMQQFPESNCIVSTVEHEAVLEPAMQYQHKLAPVQPDGRVDIDKLIDLIDDQTVLISVMYANNEIGTVQPIAELARRLQGVRDKRQQSDNKLPLYLHADAAQAGNYLPLLVNTLGVDLMSLNGGKIYGPKQSGILFVKTGTVLRSQILGGGQERGLRSGTENVAAIVGFAAALKEAAEFREAESQRLQILRDGFIDNLKSRLPAARINGSLKHRLPNNLHLTIPDTDNETVMMRLDESGFMVATGSACSASSDDPSLTLKAIGLSDKDARASLRITTGRPTDQVALDKLLDALVTSVAN